MENHNIITLKNHYWVASSIMLTEFVLVDAELSDGNSFLPTNNLFKSVLNFWPDKTYKKKLIA